jgi:hypothetical protein
MTMPALSRSLVLSALVFAAACAGERDDHPARVTIDMRCDSTADCPSGFSCASEDDHGPPTTMCESEAPVTCPPGYKTKIGYGQTFCKPQGAAGARSSLLTSSGSYETHAFKTRAADGHTSWSAR